jgi:hypothetical protein
MTTKFVKLTDLPKVAKQYCENRQMTGLLIGDYWYVEANKLNSIAPVGTSTKNLPTDINVEELVKELNELATQYGITKQENKNYWIAKSDIPEVNGKAYDVYGHEYPVEYVTTYFYNVPTKEVLEPQEWGVFPDPFKVGGFELSPVANDNNYYFSGKPLKAMDPEEALFVHKDFNLAKQVAYLMATQFELGENNMKTKVLQSMGLN